MLSPSPMPSKKNHIFDAIIFVALAIFVSGCAPPGPRALLKGKKLIERGDYAGAVAQLKIATDILSTNAQAWNYYGVALEHSGQFDDAANAYQNALKFDRDLVEAHYNLGCLWMEQNKFADAKTEFTAYTLRRSNTPEGWLKLGAAQLKANDLILAEKSFSTAYAINTNSAEALNGLGLCRVAREHYDDAGKFFAAAIKLQPNFAPARLNLAVLDEQNLHDDKGALANYIAYLTAMPQAENHDAVNARITALETPGKVAATSPPTPKENEVDASQRNPAESKPQPTVSHPVQITRPPPPRTNPEPVARAKPEPTIVAPPRLENQSAETRTVAPRNYNNSGVTPLPPLNATQQPKPPVKMVEPAPPTFPRYLYLSPKKPGAGDHKAAAQAFTQGRQFEASQQLANAMDAYEKAASLDPSWFEAQYNYGVLAYREKDYSRALAADEMALAIQPDSMAARYNFALALKAGGYATDAVNELKKIIVKDPNNVDAHLALGNLYAQQMHDPVDARLHYLRVLALNPRNPSAGEIQFWLAANPQ